MEVARARAGLVRERAAKGVDKRVGRGGGGGSGQEGDGGSSGGGIANDAAPAGNIHIPIPDVGTACGTDARVQGRDTPPAVEKKRASRQCNRGVAI